MTRASPKADKLPGFIRKQYEFTAHIRDPENNPAPPEIDRRRMAVYRELFYSNVEDFMASSYPVLKEVLGETRWQEMIRDYFARHQARTPLFPQMPSELLEYLEHERPPRDGDPPFLLELAHYEWAELALMNADADIDEDTIDADGDLLAGIPVLSPLAVPLSYRYPVHRIGPACQPREPGPQPTFIVVYRDREDEVGFLEISAATYRVLQLLSSPERHTGLEALQRVAAELRHPDPEAVITAGQRALAELRERHILLGTARA